MKCEGKEVTRPDCFIDNDEISTFIRRSEVAKNDYGKEGQYDDEPYLLINVWSFCVYHI